VHPPCFLSLPNQTPPPPQALRVCGDVRYLSIQQPFQGLKIKNKKIKGINGKEFYKKTKKDFSYVFPFFLLPNLFFKAFLIVLFLSPYNVIKK